MDLVLWKTSYYTLNVFETQSLAMNLDSVDINRNIKENAILFEIELKEVSETDLSLLANVVRNSLIRPNTSSMYTQDVFWLNQHRSRLVSLDIGAK